tara:strand:+ start:724 stop:999 length:276 start_codon:yes stop_codon:yes gene_type:complete
MNKFVMKYIINDIRWQQHKIAIQIDISLDGTTPPKGFLSFDSHLLVWKPECGGYAIQLSWKIFKRLLMEPFLKQRRHLKHVPRVLWDFKGG